MNCVETQQYIKDEIIHCGVKFKYAKLIKEGWEDRNLVEKPVEDF